VQALDSPGTDTVDGLDRQARRDSRDDRPGRPENDPLALSSVRSEHSRRSGSKRPAERPATPSPAEWPWRTRSKPHGSTVC